MVEGVLKSSADGSRFVIEPIEDGYSSVELHCGDVVQLFIGGVWIAVRVEMNDHGFYVTTGDESFRPFFGMKALVS